MNRMGSGEAGARLIDLDSALKDPSKIHLAIFNKLLEVSSSYFSEYIYLI